MKIAIDVGYSNVKPISESGAKVLIPSVVAPHRELPLAELAKNGIGYSVEIRRVNGDSEKYFVGDLALREGRCATFTMDRKKHLHPNHDVLVLTAAKALGAGIGTTLIAGLPIAYYREQKEELTQHYLELHAEVKINGDRMERVSFDKVIIYPQGAGALLTISDLPDTGLVLLVDIGQKTTDYITAEVQAGIARPVSSLCDSVEVGVHDIFEAIAAEFRSITGAPLDLTRAPEIFMTGKVFYRGKEIDFTDYIRKVRRTTAQSLADKILASLGDKADFVRKVYLAGGGAEALLETLGMFPTASIISDPQWANARGFMKLASIQ